MDLYTRCPVCDTTFRVTTQQLQASSGQVRCGECHGVFDAFATLTAREPQPAPEPSPQLPPESTGPAPAAAEPPSSRPSPPDPAASLYEWEFRMPPSPRHTLAWACAALVLLLLLAVQGALAFRAEVTAAFPQAANWYAHACRSLGCTFPPAKFLNYLHIEASDLNVVDPARPEEIEVSLAVRNRAPIDMRYPAFELTLTDSAEQAIARRVFLPPEYFGKSMPSAALLRAGGDMSVRMYLDTGKLRAAGYRIYLFYP
ncbi:MAG TPA: zinc-ribbon and DUF3426 domain-containing protein [Burkholderiales bacterium]|nr:zinc-ribbon and DUF3426 domain-containing protein [Burkholderiales bacterium]